VPARLKGCSDSLRLLDIPETAKVSIIGKTSLAVLMRAKHGIQIGKNLTPSDFRGVLAEVVAAL